MIRKIHNNAKYNAIPPEEVNTTELYSFSFNPEEQPLFERFYSCKLNNLKDWSQQQYNILTSLKYAEVECVLECSRQGRLHWHGWIIIREPIDFYLKDIKKLKHYGTYEIDHIEDSEKWSNYVYKQMKHMKKFADRNSMIYEIKKCQ